MRLGDFLIKLTKPAAWAPAAMFAGLLALGGCEAAFQKGWIDPGEMMRLSQDRLLVPVLPSLAEGLDEADSDFANAEDVKQADLKPSTADYVIGRNDLLSISITEVAGPGVESVKTTRVSESGNVSLPLIGSQKAAGLTEAELEKAIAQTYRDKNLIQNAQVSVTVIEARQRTFSILGAVGRPGQYQIVQSDFRLLDALTLAGDVPVQGIENCYIIRKTPKAEDTGSKPADTGNKPADTGAKPKPVDPLEGKPQGRANFSGQPVHLMLLDAPTDPIDPSEGGRKILIDGKWVTVKPPAGDTPATPAPTPAPTAAPTPAPTPTPTPAADPLAPRPDAGATTATPVTPAPGTTGTFEFEAPKPDPDTRILRVPLERLQRGELQYNVVIRPNDTIIIPSPKVGEYYMGGHVGRAGVYSLTGRNITLKQAIISAGMIDPLGWPERTEVIRRIGKDKEMFVRVNLPKIFAGEQSDFYLRPYDTVSVGTNALAPFLAAIRNAFRFTYGFGFIYDQNFSPDAAANQRNR